MQGGQAGAFHVAATAPGTRQGTLLLYRVFIDSEGDQHDVLLSDDLRSEYLDQLPEPGKFRYELRYQTKVIAEHAVELAPAQSLTLIAVRDGEAIFSFQHKSGEMLRAFTRIGQPLTLIREHGEGELEVIELPYTLVDAKLRLWYGLRRTEVAIGEETLGLDGRLLTLRSFEQQSDAALRAQITLRHQDELLTLDEGESLDVIR